MSMEEIQDLSWMRQLIGSSMQEHLKEGKYRLVVFAAASTALRHLDRFRYRALFFEGSRHKPFLAINLESTILGDFCLTAQLGPTHSVLARLDSAPSYASFREMALEKAKSFLPAAKARKASPKSAKAKTATE